MALVLLVSGAASYQLPAPHQLSLQPRPRAAPAVCRAGGSAGRGFGKKEEPRKKSANKGARDVLVGPGAPVAPTPTLSESLGGGVPTGASASRGKAALDRLRADALAATPPRSKMELTQEELDPLSPEAGVMPEVVSQRMLRRVVPFAGLPVFGSVVLFAGFYFANTQLELDLPPQIVAVATQALLLLSFAGITYGVMSTSWDEEDEGSALGFTEFIRNVGMARGDNEQRRGAAMANANPSPSPSPNPHPNSKPNRDPNQARRGDGRVRRGGRRGGRRDDEQARPRQAGPQRGAMKATMVRRGGDALRWCCGGYSADRREKALRTCVSILYNTLPKNNDGRDARGPRLTLRTRGVTKG
jgi:hypothetical protein